MEANILGQQNASVFELLADSRLSLLTYCISNARTLYYHNGRERDVYSSDYHAN